MRQCGTGLTRHGWLCAIGLVLGALLVTGCDALVITRQQRDAFIEPNNTFRSATPAVPGATGLVHIKGSIQNDDIDVYDLGPMAAGDIVQVSVETTSGLLMTTVALFDVQTRLVAINPVDTIGDRWYSFEETMHHSTESLYLGVARVEGTLSSGDYDITVRVARDGPIPGPQGQVVVLDFEGGRVQIDRVGTYTIEPFSAEMAGFDAADTDELRDVIRQTVDENFRFYDVIVLTTDDPLPDEPVSRVYLGGFARNLFGAAEDVDAYNQNPSEKALIFVETFPGSFPYDLTLTEMGTAIGNVTSHEIGHLLGLNHTASPNALMDSVNPPYTFAQDQEFIWTDLAGQIFPIGTQDAPTLLIETVGLVP